MNILIFTDSLGLPREKPEYVKYEETWPYLVKQNFPKANVFQVSLGGATIEELYRQVDYYKVINPDLVIIQAGIVDCAPRALKKIELQILQHYGLLNRFVLPVMQKRSNFLRKSRHISYTSPESFENIVSNFCKIFGRQKILWLGIVPATKEYEIKLPGINASITNYNSILEKQLKENFVETLSFPNEGIMSDFHHLNAIGHHWMFIKIEQTVKIMANSLINS